MVSVPKGVNRYKLTPASVRAGTYEWKKGKNNYIKVKPVVSTSSRRYNVNWKIVGRGVGVPKKRIFKTDEQAISAAIKMMRGK